MQLQQEKRTGTRTTVLLGALAGVASVFFPFVLICVPALWAYAMCRTRPISLAVCGGVFAVAAALLLGAFAGGCLTVLCVGCAAALYYMQINCMSNAYTVAAVSGIALVCLYALVCLPGILSGEGAFTAMQDTIRESAAALRALIAETDSLPAERAAVLGEMLDAYVALSPTLAVPALTILSGVLGLGNYLFFRLFCRGKGFPITTLRAFKYWSIPRSLTTGLIVMLIGSLVLGLAGWDYADALTNTVNAIVGMPLMLQGLCVLDYFISRKADGRAATRRVIAYSVTGLFLVVAQTPLIMLGCFDQLFRFRARAAMPPPSL